MNKWHNGNHKILISKEENQNLLKEKQAQINIHKIDKKNKAKNAIEKMLLYE